MLPHRKHRRCREWNEPGYREDNRPAPRCHYALPFENSGGYGRVEKLNIPIIECADYMETSALGRAEWMRFYGLLFGEAQKADSLFAEVEKNYNELKALVAPLSYAPSVISELKNGSAWYVPGGKSTSARIYADAGANYVFADDEHSGSVPLPSKPCLTKVRMQISGSSNIISH